jgi:hypothetical protein
MIEWLKRKVGLLSNEIKIGSRADLISKTSIIDNLVVYIGDLTSHDFQDYQEVAKDYIQQDDIEFVHTHSMPSELLETSSSSSQSLIRVYR